MASINHCIGVKQSKAIITQRVTNTQLALFKGSRIGIIFNIYLMDLHWITYCVCKWLSGRPSSTSHQSQIMTRLPLLIIPAAICALTHKRTQRTQHMLSRQRFTPPKLHLLTIKWHQVIWTTSMSQYYYYAFCVFPPPGINKVLSP